jgi:ATP-dependent helicase HrpA
MSSSPPPFAQLRERLAALTLRDERSLGRRLESLQRGKQTSDRAVQALTAQIARAEGLVARRRQALPVLTYPDNLPISRSRDEIAAAIQANQVVIIAGETGSGKTTQLPKICLELGRGVRGTIGHTQPRRLAARTVAARIADELHTELGAAIGFTVRFTDQVSDRTLVKLMTDGVLLAEIQRDRDLLRYDTLIIDEAHERSLNIDFILGYLTQLLPRRPDLKVIVTSATIDPQRFAAHFGNAPVIEVSGRTFPVEVRYRPLAPDPLAAADDDEGDSDTPMAPVRDRTDAIVEGVRELSAAGPGDILVFLSGEREIRDTADALNALELPNTEVLPLYARLSTAEQMRVFADHSTRRVVLATNVAETSLTVPGIHYVIDPGTARISRYSFRTKVQRLPIEAISQASANQRAGRCGRVADGICIRLYSEADYLGRPRFTEPEILRTSLASVILQMTALDLGELDRFPFIDPPDRRSVRDGVALLTELGAVEDHDGKRRLTPIGRQLAQLPIDPQLARMLVQAREEGCVREVIVIAAALSIQDPRERPADQAAAAAQKHARFANEDSDFIGFLNLWNYLREQRAGLSGNQFRRLCREEFLHYLRIREWQDLAGQLRHIAGSLDIIESDQPADPQRVHSAVLSGLLSHVGQRVANTREYLGARNSRFVLSPGSALAKRPPAWVVAAELVETSRLYGRVAARVDPEAVERLAGHLVARTYSEPHWDRRRGAVMAFERVTLYGLTLVPRRRVNYSNVDAGLAREMFIQHALVEGEWDTRHTFFHDNQVMMTELASLEERSRRRDLLLGDDALVAFYEQRIPAEVVSSRHFDSWWKSARRTSPALLTLTRADVLNPAGQDVASDAAPEVWTEGELALPLTYRFDPGDDEDGVTVHIPMDVLAQVDGNEFSWQVPALREELVTALIRSLPKPIRRNFVPAPDTARAVLARLTPGAEPLLDGLQRELHDLTGVLVPLSEFSFDRVPAHLRVSFAIEDDVHRVVARGKDLAVLKTSLAEPARRALTGLLGAGLERDGLRSWPTDLVLARITEKSSAGHQVHGYPTLVDHGESVAVRVVSSVAEQRASMQAGTRRLLRLSIPSPGRALARGLTTAGRMTLAASPDGGPAGIIDDCIDAAIDDLVARAGGPAWDAAAFGQLSATVADRLPALAADVVARVERVLTVALRVRGALPVQPSVAVQPSIADIAEQLRQLLGPGFVTRTGVSRLGDLARYLGAIEIRLSGLPRDVEVDSAKMVRVHTVQRAYSDLVAALPVARGEEADVREIGWQLEEFRVSLFAQQLGTPKPVSEQRIYRAMDAISP